MEKSIKSYTDLDAWKKGRELTKNIYLLTSKFPKEEMFGLVSQMRRCSVSYTANIAEGHGRKTTPDTLHFLSISRGSLFELESHAYASFDVNYISKDELENTLALIIECKKLINGLIRYFETLRSS